MKGGITGLCLPCGPASNLLVQHTRLFLTAQTLPLLGLDLLPIKQMHLALPQ